VLVVKVGGGLLEHAGRLDAVLAEVARAGRDTPLLIVPGGGPFADAVREVDRRHHLSDDAAHWMAVLAMDQYAQLIASRVMAGTVVATQHGIAAAWDAGEIPVLAPYRWLREADPLPHSWDVTSDSIAAWVAGQVGARTLVLVKPPGAEGRGAVDAHFVQALPAYVVAEVLHADRIDVLRSVTRNGPRSRSGQP